MSTKTQIDRPDEEEQAAQVATLISGTAITDAALKPARALMAARRRGEGTPSGPLSVRRGRLRLEKKRLVVAVREAHPAAVDAVARGRVEGSEVLRLLRVFRQP